MLAFRRGLRLVSGRTAFGDASESDAESVLRQFYALRSSTFMGDDAASPDFRIHTDRSILKKKRNRFFKLFNL